MDNRREYFNTDSGNDNGSYTFNFNFVNGHEVNNNHYDSKRTTENTLEHLEKIANTENALATSSKFCNAFNVQDVEIIQETKNPGI